MLFMFLLYGKMEATLYILIKCKIRNEFSLTIIVLIVIIIYFYTYINYIYLFIIYCIFINILFFIPYVKSVRRSNLKKNLSI